NSQSFTVLEMGANAKVLYPLLKFLQVQTLIITDIDSVKDEIPKEKKVWKKNTVENGTDTSNATLKFFYDGEDNKTDAERKLWFDKLKNRQLELKQNDN